MFLYVLLGGLVLGVQSAVLTIRNTTNKTICIGIYNYDHNSLLSSSYNTTPTGFILPPNGNEPFNVTQNWRGKVWPRTGCSDACDKCLTGDCGGKECNGTTGTPPFTQVEVEFKYGNGTAAISLVEGYNLGVKVFSDLGRCVDRCDMFVDTVCPKSMKTKAQKSDTTAIGCLNNCGAFNSDSLCCRGDSEGGSCNPDNWPTTVVDIFKTQCPGAFTYPFDQPKRGCTPIGPYINIEFHTLQ